MLISDPCYRKGDEEKAEVVGLTSSWVEHGGTARITEGQPSPPRRVGSLARSRNVILEAWKELIRGEFDVISKAVYMRVYFHIVRRGALEPDGPGARPSAYETEPLDVLSMAENSWATSSKGYASINFEQFKEAWRDMARGLGATTTDSARYDVFCSAATEVCRMIGKEQLAIPSGERVAMLLATVRQTSYGCVHNTETRVERGLANRGGLRANNKQLQRHGVASWSLRDEGCSVTSVAHGPAQGSSGSRLWPPAWVKLKEDRRSTVVRGARGEESAPVLAKGIFTTPPPPFGGQMGIGTSRVKDADPGLLLKGSTSSQEALSLQQELRHDRVRFLEVQRQPRHRPAVSSIASADSATARTDADAADLLPKDLLQCRTVPDLHPSSGAGVGSGYEPLRGQRDAAMTCIAMNGARCSQGSPKLSMGSRGTLHSESNETESSQGSSARGKVVLVLPCRLCRRQESAMWCSECKAAFCIPCFESLPHHLGTGVVSSRDREVPEPRRPWGAVDTNFSLTLLKGSTVPLGDKAVSVPGDDSKEENNSIIELQCECERNAKRKALMPGRLRLGRTMTSKGFPTDSAGISLEGSRMGSRKGRRKRSHRASGLLSGKESEQKLAVLPQNEFGTSRFIPAMCFNSGTGGLCSARDFRSTKNVLDSTKVITPTTQMQLDVYQENGRHCRSYHHRSDQPAAGCGVEEYDGVNGVSRSVKTFGRIPVHIMTSS